MKKKCVFRDLNFTKISTKDPHDGGEAENSTQEFSKSLGGPLTLGGIFQKPGWNFPQSLVEISCLPPRRPRPSIFENF